MTKCQPEQRQAVYYECKAAVLTYRQNLVPIEKARKSLRLVDFSTFSQHQDRGNKLLNETFSLRDATMKHLDDL